MAQRRPGERQRNSDRTELWGAPGNHWNTERRFACDDGARAELRTYLVGQLLAGLLLLLAVNFLRKIGGEFHAFNREQFHVVRWSIGANMAGAFLISFYARYRSWSNQLRQVIVSDALVSLFALVLALLAHRFNDSPDSAHSFNLAFAIFLFAKCSMWTWFACRNSSARPNAWQSAYVFLAAFILLATYTRWYNMAEVPEADESHYTLLTYSLLHDHDFDVANNYAAGDYAEQFPPHIPGFWVRDSDMHGIRREPHVVTNFRGQSLLWHDVGMPVLLLPGYALGKRFGAQITVALITATLAVALMNIALLLELAVPTSVAVAMLFIFSPPVFLFAPTVFTELIGGTGIAYALLAFLRYRRNARGRYLVFVGILFGLLPWINIRFWVLEFPLFAIFAAYLTWTQQRKLTELVTNLLRLGLPILASLAFFAWFDHVHFNTYLPNAGYRILQSSMPQFWNKPYQGLLGLFFDRSYGLAPTAPLYVTAFAGLAVLWKRDRWGTAAMALPFGVYVTFLSFSQYWSGGWNPAGRYLLSSIVLLIPAAAAISWAKTKWLLAPLIAWTTVVDLIFVNEPHWRWPAYYEESGLFHKFGSWGHIGNGSYNVLSIFPNLVKPSLHDYVLALCWFITSLLAAWWMARSSVAPRQSALVQ